MFIFSCHISWGIKKWGRVADINFESVDYLKNILNIEKIRREDLRAIAGEELFNEYLLEEIL